MDPGRKSEGGRKNDDDEQITRNEVEARMMESEYEGRARSRKDEEERMMMSNVSVPLGEEASFKCVGFEVIWLKRMSIQSNQEETAKGKGEEEEESGLRGASAMGGGEVGRGRRQRTLSLLGTDKRSTMTSSSYSSSSSWFPPLVTSNDESEQEENELLPESNSKHDHDLSFNQGLREGWKRNPHSHLSFFDTDDGRGERSKEEGRKKKNPFTAPLPPSHHHTQPSLSPHQSMMFGDFENNNDRQHGSSSRASNSESNSIDGLQDRKSKSEVANRSRRWMHRESENRDEIDSSTLDFAPLFNQLFARKNRDGERERRRGEEDGEGSQTLIRSPDGIHSAASLLPSSKFISHLSEPDSHSNPMEDAFPSLHNVLVDGHLFQVLSTTFHPSPRSNLVHGESDGSHLNELRLRHVSPGDGGEYICLSRHSPNSSGYTFQNAFLTLQTRTTNSSESDAFQLESGFLDQQLPVQQEQQNDGREDQDQQQEQQQQREVHHSKYQHSQHNQLLLHHRTSSPSSPFQVLHHRKGRGREDGREVTDKMLWPLVNSSSEAMVTLGLPILVTILMLLCVLFVLILIIRKRTEPKIPDLSDPKSDPLLDEDPLFKSSITRELFYPPIGRSQHECLRMDTSYSGLFVDGNSNSKNSCSSKLNTRMEDKKKQKKGLSAHLDWLSPSSSEWLSINDDLYKNYYQDPRGSFLTQHPPASYTPTTLHPVTSLRRRNSYSPIRDWPRDELLFPRRGSGMSSSRKEQGRMLQEYDDLPTTGRRGEEKESIGFTYNSPQPERISLPSSSFISSCSSPPSTSSSHLRSYNSSNNLLPYHQHGYPSSNHYNPYLGYDHRSVGSSTGLEGSGMSCCDPAPRFDTHSSCLCSLNHFPHHGPT